MTSVKFTLKQARKYKGLTQDEMAKVLKMAKRTYIDYEQYKIPLRIDKAYLFAESVGFSIDDIIFFDPDLHFKCS
ncbi:helix-turn-helix transcriptional regulator [Peribacillus castrilensis]|uniref:helix-turn-helix transcriptional regulator n=1 Tax=Peribacillus TaxID=2675229 RepID=UPI0038723294